MRNAALIFVAIVQHGNVLSARTLAIEYMKAQRADAGLPNWANLKLFLDLPPEQPGGDMPERAQALGRSLGQVLTTGWALKRSRGSLFAGLTYRTPEIGGNPARTVEGDDILKAIREFIRSDNTGQAFS